MMHDYIFNFWFDNFGLFHSDNGVGFSNMCIDKTNLHDMITKGCRLLL